jgi:hypothetical protein
MLSLKVLSTPLIGEDLLLISNSKFSYLVLQFDIIFFSHRQLLFHIADELFITFTLG